MSVWSWGQVKQPLEPHCLSECNIFKLPTNLTICPQFTLSWLQSLDMEPSWRHLHALNPLLPWLRPYLQAQPCDVTHNSPSLYVRYPWKLELDTVTNLMLSYLYKRCVTQSLTYSIKNQAHFIYIYIYIYIYIGQISHCF